MLYKKNKDTCLSDELFRNPTSEYRGTPFWAWNSLLTEDELLRQIDILKEMGLGGFHMHVRTGLKNRYLSNEYMELIKTCVKKAKDENMLAWLYDEDRWPSGAAGGIVTADEKYRGRNLLFTPFRTGKPYQENASWAVGGRNDDEKLLACYDIVLDEEGYLRSYKMIDENDEPQGVKWYAFSEINTPSAWFNDKTYADTLNKDAIKRFIEVTHEKYKKTIGEEFDKTVPAIFTDEPQFSRKTVLNNSFDRMDIIMPWTDSVPEKYKEMYGEDIMEHLPEVFWDKPGSAPSIHRYRYHDFIAELFASSFADTVGGWCKKNNISLTGHMMEEPTLRSQTAALGEAMRSYRSFQIPGIDMLCNNHEFTTAKQAQSAVHQFGREGMLSELYGVTGWDCDFRTYKHQGDWQACLGVTVRVPHLSWYSMAGESKRDYPASISYQSPWYKKWPLIEDHFARVNTAMTRGKPVVKTAVIHPIESFWLHWGPNDKSGIFRESLDERFKNITQWLIEGSIDFDFIAESLLPSLCKNGSAPLKVGEMEYDTIIVPGCETLRSSTLERLEAFRKAGGRLIFMGDAPSLTDAVPSDRGRKLFDLSENIDFSRAALLTALENSRLLTLRYSDGRLTDKFIYQLRKDNDCMWLFICQDSEPLNKNCEGSSEVKIILEGEFSPEVYDTCTGRIYRLKAEYKNGRTYIPYTFYAYDSLLLRLTEGRCTDGEVQFIPSPAESGLYGKIDYELSEENVLLLDTAYYKLDGDKEYSGMENILRLDNICRERAGFREKGGNVAQPWTQEEKEADRKITLKFEISSRIDYSGACLALEDAEKAEILFNSVKTDNTVKGYYVDRSIKKVVLPDIKKGKNILEVTLPFGENTNTENMFITGNFGVKTDGAVSEITELPEKITFGLLGPQGFPFYGGAVTYKVKAENKDKGLTVTVPNYYGALVSIAVDGAEKGDIIYPPYTLYMPDIEPGIHNVDIKLYIHRYNSFGALHLTRELSAYHGPEAWRTTGSEWSYDYIFRRTGLLSAPGIK